jgi:hypothetical protein
VIAVHQHLGLDDRHQILFLAQGRIARERMRIGADAIVARDAGADIDDGPPFAEFRAELAILDQSLAQAVEAFGDGLAGGEGKRLRSLIDLDAGDGARRLDHLDERRPVLRLLPDGLVEENHAGNAVRHGLGGAEQKLAVVAAARFSGFDPDGAKALRDRSTRLVGGENALAGRHHRVGHVVQFSKIHHPLREWEGFLPPCLGQQTPKLNA